MRTSHAAVLLVHAFVGWALCAAVMGLGMALTTVQTSLYIHAAAAPLIFAGVTGVYTARFGYTTPLQTACAFLGFVLAMDFFVVALLVNRSMEMFRSPIGTWLPFGLIFTSALVTARSVARREEHVGIPQTAPPASVPRP